MKKTNIELQRKNLQPTVKHGGGNVMIWGCMAYNDVGNIAFIDSIINAEKYIEVLRDNLEGAINLSISETYYFQQDNDSKHTAKKTKEQLLYNVPRQLVTTPTVARHINPIKNLWHLLDLKVRKRKISNKNDLKKMLSEEWSKISIETTKKLIESIPRRLEAIIEAKGIHTKY